MATVKQQITYCHRCNSDGTFYNTALFVGGQRIAKIYLPEHAVWAKLRRNTVGTVLDAIECYGSVKVAISDDDDDDD